MSVRKEVDSLESFVILWWSPNRFSGDGRCGRARTVAHTSARMFVTPNLLQQFYSERGRAVYVWLDRGMEEAVKGQRLFDNLETVEVFDPPGPGRLLQILEPFAPATVPTSGVN